MNNINELRELMEFLLNDIDDLETKQNVMNKLNYINKKGQLSGRINEQELANFVIGDLLFDNTIKKRLNKERNI